MSVVPGYGSPRGSIHVMGKGVWASLAPGTAGQVLITQGPGADPTWGAGGGGDLTSAVVKSPDSGTRNTITIPGDWSGLSIFGLANATADLFNVVQDGASADLFIVSPAGSGFVTRMQSNNPNDIVIYGQPAVSQAVNPYQLGCNLDLSSNVSAIIAISIAAEISGQLQVSDDPTTVRACYKLTPFFSNAVDATRQGGFILKSKDATAYRDVIRGDTDGTQALLGVLGAAAVAQQPTASAGGITGIRSDTLANAVSDIKTVLTALRAWGVTFGFNLNTA